MMMVAAGKDDLSVSREALVEECRIMTAYLLDDRPTDELIQRYIDAHTILLNEHRSPKELAVATFVRRYPWALSSLDAVLAVLRPAALLRSKILLMIAILETVPQYTDHFFPEAVSGPRFFLRMAGYGLASAAKFVLGCCLYPFAVHAR